MALKDEVRRWRENTVNWTQQQAADWYGVSARQWRKYESGRAQVPYPLILRINEYERMKRRIRELDATVAGYNAAEA